MRARSPQAKAICHWLQPEQRRWSGAISRASRGNEPGREGHPSPEHRSVPQSSHGPLRQQVAEASSTIGWRSIEGSQTFRPMGSRTILDPERASAAFARDPFVHGGKGQGPESAETSARVARGREALTENSSPSPVLEPVASSRPLCPKKGGTSSVAWAPQLEMPQRFLRRPRRQLRTIPFQPTRTKPPVPVNHSGFEVSQKDRGRIRKLSSLNWMNSPEIEPLLDIDRSRHLRLMIESQMDIDLAGVAPLPDDIEMNGFRCAPIDARENPTVLTDLESPVGPEGQSKAHGTYPSLESRTPEAALGASSGSGQSLQQFGRLSRLFLLVLSVVV